MESVNASLTSSLFDFHQNGDYRAEVRISDTHVSHSILNQSLFYATGSKLALSVLNFTLEDLSYEEANPSSEEGLFLLEGLSSFEIKNTNITV